MKPVIGDTVTVIQDYQSNLKNGTDYKVLKFKDGFVYVEQDRKAVGYSGHRFTIKERGPLSKALEEFVSEIMQ